MTTRNVKLLRSFIPLVVAFAASGVALYTTSTSPVIVGVAVGVISVSFLISSYMFCQFLVETDYQSLRVALTGQPGAGKTVLAYLLYDFLLNNELGFSFTASSRSAIATYQAIRGIGEDRWPAATPTSKVVQYDGEITLSRNREIALEIGDSAGEHWIALSSVNGGEENDSFLEWVLSAGAVAHVVPPEAVFSSSENRSVIRDVNDLRLASQLTKSTRREPVPLLVVFSKADVYSVSSMETETPIDIFDVVRELMVVKSGEEMLASELVSKISDAGIFHLKWAITRFAAELRSAYSSVSFMFTSTESAIGDYRSIVTRTPDFTEWLVRTADQRSKQRQADMWR